MSDDVKKKWNELAAKFNLPVIRGKVHPALMNQYMFRIGEEPDFWNILANALPKRSEFYVERRQPSFQQATKGDFFTDKIRDGSWDDPKHYRKTTTQGTNLGSKTPQHILDRLEREFEEKHGIDPNIPNHPINLNLDDLPF